MIDDRDYIISELKDNIEREQHWFILLLSLLVISGAIFIILLESKKLKVY